MKIVNAKTEQLIKVLSPNPTKNNGKLKRRARTLSHSGNEKQKTRRLFWCCHLSVFLWSCVGRSGCFYYLPPSGYWEGVGSPAWGCARGDSPTSNDRSAVTSFVYAQHSAGFDSKPPHVLEVLPVKIGFDNRVTDSSESRWVVGI